MSQRGMICRNSAMNSGVPAFMRFISASTAGSSFSKPAGAPDPIKFTGLLLRIGLATSSRRNRVSPVISIFMWIPRAVGSKTTPYR